MNAWRLLAASGLRTLRLTTTPGLAPYKRGIIDPNDRTTQICGAPMAENNSAEVHALLLLNSYHDMSGMTVTQAAETLETLVRWSE